MVLAPFFEGMFEAVPLDGFIAGDGARFQNDHGVWNLESGSRREGLAATLFRLMGDFAGGRIMSQEAFMAFGFFAAGDQRQGRRAGQCREE